MRKPGHPQGVHRHKRYGQMALGIGGTIACSQPLYEDGQQVAVCTQPYGTEHDHSDKTASEALERGLARPCK